MAEKTPSDQGSLNIGSARLLWFDFTDIDDDDTFKSGVTGIIGTPLFVSSVDNSDCVIDDVSLVSGVPGTMTFGSSANNAGTLFVITKY